MESPQKGKQSVAFDKEVYIRESASIVGTKEGEDRLEHSLTWLRRTI